MRKINEVIVHCSATPEGRDVTVETIDKWHKGNGWKGIGYHWVIYRDGSIHAGRPESQIGAHCKGKNRNTIGICYIGGMDKANKHPKDTRTQAQRKAMVQLLSELKMRYVTIEKISGHRDYANKACPSFDATREYAALFMPQPEMMAEVETPFDEVSPSMSIPDAVHDHLQDMDKPITSSKTFWSSIAGTVIAPLIAVLTNPWVQALLILCIFAVMAWVIYDRNFAKRKRASIARAAIAKLGK